MHRRKGEVRICYINFEIFVFLKKNVIIVQKTDSKIINYKKIVVLDCIYILDTVQEQNKLTSDKFVH